MLLLGIEEAGKGPVVGPMIMYGVLIEDTEEYKFKETKNKVINILGV